MIDMRPQFTDIHAVKAAYAELLAKHAAVRLGDMPPVRVATNFVREVTSGHVAARTYVTVRRFEFIHPPEMYELPVARSANGVYFWRQRDPEELSADAPCHVEAPIAVFSWAPENVVRTAWLLERMATDSQCGVVQKKPRKIRFHAYMIGDRLTWHDSSKPVHKSWIRMPSEDKEVEVQHG